MAEESAVVPTSYTQEQVQQILNVAIAQQTYEGEFSRQQLFEIADELGIPPQCLTAAEQSWLQHHAESQARLTFDLHRRGELRHKAERFGLVSSCLLLLNVLTGFASPWCLFVIGPLALKLGFDTWTVYYPDEASYERAFRKWSRKRHLSAFVNRWWSRLLSV